MVMSKFCANTNNFLQFRFRLDSETLMCKGIRAVDFFYRLERQRSDGVGKGVKHFVYNIRKITIENRGNPY